MRKAVLSVSAFCAALVPFVASAHEVYVLTPGQIATDVGTPAFSEWQVILQNLHQFVFWGVLSIIVVFFVFFASLWHVLEKTLKPLFSKLKNYAPHISRIAIGIALMASSYHSALFGPELPLSVYDSVGIVVRGLLLLAGIMCVFNRGTRIAAALVLIVFAAHTYMYGWYMLTYAAYVGELGGVLFLTYGALSQYRFFFLRVCFGIGLLYSSLYAKILHNNLALQVASTPLAGHAHSLAYYFGFEPHFLVLGAAILEVVLALFFILGIEIRFISLFLLFWLSLSLAYFGEAVWPHLVLIGIPLAFICWGYDAYSLEAYYVTKKGRAMW